MVKYQNAKRRDIKFELGQYVYLKTTNLKVPNSLTKKFA